MTHFERRKLKSGKRNLFRVIQCTSDRAKAHKQDFLLLVFNIFSTTKNKNNFNWILFKKTKNPVGNKYLLGGHRYSRVLRWSKLYKSFGSRYEEEETTRKTENLG